MVGPGPTRIFREPRAPRGSDGSARGSPAAPRGPPVEEKGVRGSLSPSGSLVHRIQRPPRWRRGMDGRVQALPRRREGMDEQSKPFRRVAGAWTGVPRFPTRRRGLDGDPVHGLPTRREAMDEESRPFRRVAGAWTRRPRSSATAGDAGRLVHGLPARAGRVGSRRPRLPDGVGGGRSEKRSKSTWRPLPGSFAGVTLHTSGVGGSSARRCFAQTSR